MFLFKSMVLFEPCMLIQLNMPYKNFYRFLPQNYMSEINPKIFGMSGKKNNYFINKVLSIIMLIASIYTRYSQQYQFPQLCMHLTPQDSLIETQDSNQKQKKMDYHVALKSTQLSSYSYSLLEFLKNRFHWLFLKD